VSLPAWIAADGAGTHVVDDRIAEHSAVAIESRDAPRPAPTRSVLEFLAMPGGSYAALRDMNVAMELCEAWGECLEVRVRYHGYIQRQRRMAERALAWEDLVIPDSIWQADLPGVSREAREKLERLKPGSIGQAGRIAGISPADIAVLMVHAKRLAGRGRARDEVAADAVARTDEARSWGPGDGWPRSREEGSGSEPL
jgi:tRNA U34 5-carboxymethylaminomethyl modifying enzyme MnmG/GidA